MVESEGHPSYYDDIIFNLHFYDELNNNKIQINEIDKRVLSRSFEILETKEKILSKNLNNRSNLELSSNIKQKLNSSLNKNNKSIEKSNNTGNNNTENNNTGNNNNNNTLSEIFKQGLNLSISSIFNEERNNNSNNNNEIKNMNEDCLICEEKLTFDELNTNFIECFHGFCNDCLYNYFKEKVNNNEVEDIKCPQKDCNTVIYNFFIEEKIQNDIPLLEKYIKLRERKQLMRNPDVQLCPYPDCESYAKKINDNKFVSCIDNGHKFCFFCLKDWHENKKCDINLDKSFVEWRDPKKVKRCPKCKYFIEKNSGCNHMTCTNCKYQWCWLCMQEYTYGHYELGGNCFGLQYAKSSLCSNKYLRFFFRIFMILLKSIAFTILAPFVLCGKLFDEFVRGYYLKSFAKKISYINVMLICFGTFYFILASLSSIIAVLMIFIWPLHTKIFNFINEEFF